MRRVVLREAAAGGIIAEECDLTAADMESATEMFMTNARIGIWPIRALDGRTLKVGPVTQSLQARLAPLLENPVDA
jgi:4-amino-4-deoxychorismate lyase